MASDLASALLSGDSAGLAANPELAALLPRMRLAQAMQSEGISTAPAHPVAAAARLMQALVGGQMSTDTSSKLQDIFQGNQQQYRDFAKTLPGLGGAAPAAAPSAPQRPSLAATLSQPPAPAAPPAVLGEGGKPAIPDAQGDYGPDAVMMPQSPGGIDPKHRDLLIRTVFGEAANQPPEGQAAVAAVIKNRMAAGRYGGTDVPGVVLAKNQFEPWGNPEAKAGMMGLSTQDPRYQKIGAIVDQVMAGQTPDPTGGATHFFAPKAQAALGRNVPAWAQGPGQPIGDHTFFAPEGRVGAPGGAGSAMAFSGAPAPAGGAALPPAITAGAQPQGAPQAPQAAPQAGAPQAQQPQAGVVTPEIASFIRQAIASPNPAIRKAGMDMYQGIISQQIAPPKFEEIGVDDYNNKKYGFVQAGTQRVTPYNASGNSGTFPGGLPGTGGGLESVPEGLRGTIKQMIEGRMAPPTGPALRNPQVLRLMEYANKVDPNFDGTKWAMRYKAAQDEASSGSKFSQAISSSGQVINHAAQLHDLIDKLPNVDQAWVNPFTQTYKNVVGDKDFKTTQGQYGQVKQSLAGELEKLMRGSAGASKEIQERLHGLDIAKSPTELHAAVDEILSLMEGRLGPVVDIHNKAFDKERDPTSFLDPKAQQVLQRIREQSAARAAGVTPSPSMVPPVAAATPATTPASAPITKSINGKNYIKQGDQWFEQ